MATVSQTTLSNAFSWMKMLEFRLRFHWSLFLRVQLTIIQHWFRKWLGAGQATSHYLNQWWLVYWCICASLRLNELRTHTWRDRVYLLNKNFQISQAGISNCIPQFLWDAMAYLCLRYLLLAPKSAYIKAQINGLVQDCGISIADTLDTLQCCTKSSNHYLQYQLQ